MQQAQIVVRPMTGLPVPLPQLVVFDLDWTLWPRPRFRAGPPFLPIDEGRAGVRSSCGEELDLFLGARRALVQLADAEVPVALASRTHRPKWALQWVDMIHVDDSRTLSDVIGKSPIIIRDGCKSSHVREIARRTGVGFDSILFFDDSYPDVVKVEGLGATAVHCARSEGVTDELFAEGMRRYAEGLPSPRRQPQNVVGRRRLRRRS